MTLYCLSGVEPEWAHTLHHVWIHRPERLPAPHPASSCLHRFRHLSRRGLCGDGGSAGPEQQSVWAGAPRWPVAARKRRGAEGSGDQRSVRGDSGDWLWPRWGICTKILRWRLLVTSLFTEYEISGKSKDIWRVRFQTIHSVYAWIVKTQFHCHPIELELI